MDAKDEGSHENPPRRTWARARRHIEAATLPVLGLVVVLGFFELAPRIGVLPRSSFPPISEIFTSLGDQLTTSELWRAIRDTLDAWARAMLIAMLIAIPLGMAIGASRAGQLASRVTIEFLRPIPSVALIPVLVLVFGTRPSLKITLAVFGATFPLLFQAMYGVADVDPVAKDTARAFGLRRLARLRRVVLPAAAPFLATGLRISASVALILVVTGEYIVGVPGLGEQVFLAQNGGAFDRMYALIVAAGLLGVFLNLGFYAIERRVLFWHPSHRPRDTGVGP